MVKITIAIKLQAMYGISIGIFLHLSLAHFKGQGQAYFTSEYPLDGYRKNITIGVK